jgi:hypothetical protein
MARLKCPSGGRHLKRKQSPIIVVLGLLESEWDMIYSYGLLQ